MKNIKPNTPCLVKTNCEYSYLNGSIVIALEQFDVMGIPCWAISPRLPDLDGSMSLCSAAERALFPLDNPSDSEIDTHSTRVLENINQG